jgi:translation elongation factor EF-G
VLARRRSRVLSEELREGSDQFLVHAYLPVEASFGLADEMRRKCSGAASVSALLSHWERLQVGAGAAGHSAGGRVQPPRGGGDAPLRLPPRSWGPVPLVVTEKQQRGSANAARPLCQPFSHPRPPRPFLQVDPFFVPTTEEEREEWGEEALGANLAKKLIDAVRRRKGLAVEEKVVKVATKQRTLKRNV